jgi:hypothetical protein
MEWSGMYDREEEAERLADAERAEEVRDWDELRRLEEFEATEFMTEETKLAMVEQMMTLMERMKIRLDVIR